MEYLLAIAVFEAFFLAFLIGFKARKSKSDKILIAYFSLFALTILLAALEVYNRKNNYPYPSLINTSAPTIFLHGPMLWFYIKSLTSQHFKLKAVYLLHFVPFLLAIGFFSVGVYSLPAEERILMEQTEAFKQDWLFPVMVGAIALFTQGYFFWGILLIRSHKKNLKTYFSKIEEKDLHWLNILLISCILAYASISGLYILDIFLKFLTYNTLQLIGYSIASLQVLVLGFFGLRQGNIFIETLIPIDIEKASGISFNETNIHKEDEAFIHKLLEYMKEKQPHLNPELNLSTLSEELKVTPDYLSNILNGRLNMNFFDFVNHHRIEAFKKCLCLPENKNYTLISLAYDCGFNSKATFNRVFKKTTGLTPGEYYRQVSEN